MRVKNENINPNKEECLHCLEGGGIPCRAIKRLGETSILSVSQKKVAQENIREAIDAVQSRCSTYMYLNAKRKRYNNVNQINAMPCDHLRDQQAEKLNVLFHYTTVFRK